MPARSITVIVGGLNALWAGAAFSQEGLPKQPVTDGSELKAPVKVGHVHEKVRRSTGRHERQAAEGGLYGDYSRRKLRFQKETGIQWSLDVSLMQQWGLPAGGSSALQFLTALSLDYDLFHDDGIGSGTIQPSIRNAAACGFYPCVRRYCSSGE